MKKMSGNMEKYEENPWDLEDERSARDRKDMKRDLFCLAWLENCFKLYPSGSMSSCNLYVQRILWRIEERRR